MLEIFELVERVDPADQRHPVGSPSAETISASIFWRGFRPLARPWIVTVSSPLRPSDCQEVPVLEQERQHAHADEVGAMDALEALGDHRAHAEQLRALGRPVARGACAVFLAGEDDERHASVW